MFVAGRAGCDPTRCLLRFVRFLFARFRDRFYIAGGRSEETFLRSSWRETRALVARLTETRKHFVMRGRGAFLARLAARRRAEACQVGTRTSGGARVWTPRARAATHARGCRSAEDPPMTTFTRWSDVRDDAARRGFASAASSPPPTTKPDEPEMQRVVEIEEGSHLQDIVTRATQSDVGLVFDFYADWCGPCKTLTPMLEGGDEGAAQRTNKDGGVTGPSVVLVKINVDKHAGISDELRIKSLPTIMTMRGGAVCRFRHRDHVASGGGRARGGGGGEKQNAAGS